MDSRIVEIADIDEEAESLLRQGYRIDMVMPSDAPSEMLMSRGADQIRLLSDNCPDSVNVDWNVGRAGMMYRDLIPGRLDGKLIASHIRITEAGEVPDYVHYHKIAFQMIYCWHGKVKVVYEDQGEPFWLHPGDCVLQPPEIRHRVLEAAANTQVIELTSPAVHETWADHEMQLPTAAFNPDRLFSGQRFVHHKAAESDPVYGEFGNFESHHFGIAAASNNAAFVYELRAQGDHSEFSADQSNLLSTFYFSLTGRVRLVSERMGERRMEAGDSVLIPPKTAYRLDATANSEILCVQI